MKMRAAILTFPILLTTLWLQGAAAADIRQHCAGCMSMMSYDTGTEAALTGTVDKITRHRHERMRGEHLWLKTDTETIEVHLGPVEFLRKENFTVAKGDRIEILGSRVKIEGKGVFMARSVRKGETTWTLRDEKGMPKWAGPGGNKMPHQHN